MRILHVVHQFPPDRIGGTELYTLGLSEDLMRRGHQVAVFHRAPGSPGLAHADWEGVPVYRACAGPMTPVSVYRSSFGQPVLTRAFQQAVEHFRPELIHVQHLKGLPASVVRLAQDQRIPLICTLHDYWSVCANAQLLTNYDRTICSGPRNGATNCARCAIAMLDRPASALALPLVAALMVWRNILLARALRSASVMIAPTEFVRHWFVAQGWPKDRIQVIPHGIEPPATGIGRPSRPGDGVRVAYVGGLSWQKGVHALVQALNGLQGAQLWIAGDETFDPTYVSRLRSLASPNVRFLGKLSREKVWATLAQVDVVAVPSLWYETFSLILHEAFAAGIPVIASDLGALSEAIRHGEDGWLVAPGDVEAWKAALVRLVKEPEHLSHVQANVQAPVTQEEHVNRMEDLYTHAMGSQGGAP